MTTQLPPGAIAEAEAIAEGLTGVRQRALLSYDDVRADELMFEAVTLDEPSVDVGPAQPNRTPLPMPSARARASTQPPPPPLAAWRASTRSSLPPAPSEPAAAKPSATSGDVHADLLAARRELARAAAQMRARDAYLRELENALDAQTRQLASWGLESIEGAARLTGLLRGQAFRIAELESSLDQANAALAGLQQRAEPEAAEPASDLQAIRGIGPRFAEQLSSIGIASYARVAALSADDIQRIAALLRIRPERIERDGWIEQARALCAPAPAEAE
jgi:predicted flap endonuclease-1-like 5' DNA nuclease